MGIIEKIQIDDTTLQRLTENARAHGRSLEDEAAASLRQAYARFASKDDMLAEMDRIAAMTPKSVEQTDSTVLVRQERDR